VRSIVLAGVVPLVWATAAFAAPIDIHVDYRIGNHGHRIHVVTSYFIGAPNSCPGSRPLDSSDPDWARYWSAHCAAFRNQRVRIVVRVYRMWRPTGLALVKTGIGRGGGGEYPAINGGHWNIDLFTTEFRTGCYRGKYRIKATLTDPYGRGTVSDFAFFTCR
jgi:hypothetical protein